MRNLGAACALLAAAALAPASFSAPAGRAAPFVGEGVEARLAAEGRVGVLVSREGGEMERAPSGLRVSRTMDGGRILAGSLDASGLAALSRDPNVRAIVLDRRLRPAGQVGTAQVGADRLQAAGVTGTGRTIGIIDTGIDLYHPDLGASASGGGRIVGGWSFADDNGDLFDCDGHGTAVAGVAAGSQGIAPDASIVALKVFGARDGCTSALASDVLAAVEWALDRRRELGIEVLNVSLSDDRVRPGFCDAEDPVSASVFARARAEGVSVVAASGNTGRADGVSWPACHADVVSVGMVYSVGQGPTSWDGEAGCADPYTGPDVVPCASNGGPALSLLAPGVRWSAPMAGGGRRTTFTGTSAAAPAAAASLLLARQLSPYGDPALAADFLRLTGVPVTDGRSGASTPRVDVGSAYVAPSAFSGPCASAPGEPSALVCRATVSSLVGEVASAAVALSAECPRLAGLRASLTAPDGATVVLVDGVSRGGTAFREGLGRTYESVEPLSILAGRPAAGTWTLRVEGGGAGARVTSWALHLEPQAPRRAEPEGPPYRLLPTVVHAAGLHGAFFTSDLVLFNPDTSEAADVDLSFLRAGHAAHEAARVSLTVPPLSTRVLSDVVGNVFRTTGWGSLHVNAPSRVAVASRTETTSASGGSYGLLVPAVFPEGALAEGGSPAWLVPVSRADTSRVNVGLAEVSGTPASVELVLRDGAGAVRGRLAVDLSGLESRQVNDLHGALGVTAAESDLIELRVLSGPGHVVGWATAVDNGSNDGLFVTATGLRRDAYLPAASRAPGRFGAYFRTDLKVSNPRPAPTNVRVSFYPTTGGAPSQIVLGLGAWETRLFEDVLDSLLSLPGDGAGALRLTVLGDAPGIVVSSRTHAEEPGKSYGLAIGVLEHSEAAAGDEIALSFLSSTPATRTNVGFLETSGVPTTLRVTLLGVDGERLAERELLLAPLQAVQWNDVFAEMGAEPREEASAVVQVVEGGAAMAHAIRIDNRTNDASFVPGLVVRRPVAAPAGAR